MDPLPDHGITQFVDFALVLGGGNALGAYQAGAYQALHERGLQPDRIVGASVGAVNGALIAGNRDADRLDRLRRFWRPAPRGREARWPAAETARRTLAVGAALAMGRPSVFIPRQLPGVHWLLSAEKPASLYDTTPLGRTIEQLVDFDLLNRASPRFAATAVDLESGEDTVFDTAAAPIGVSHLLASSALLPVFPPVPIGGRLYCDAGISANLPMDVVLAEPGSRPLLCLAIDLLPLAAPVPETMGEVTERAQDLIFATQSRRALAAWQAIFDQREANGTAPAVALIHIAYADQGEEVSGKAFDFSPETIQARWAAGYRDIERVLDAISAGAVTLGEAGLHVYVPAASGGKGSLQRVRYSLEPRSPAVTSQAEHA